MKNNFWNTIGDVLIVHKSLKTLERGITKFQLQKLPCLHWMDELGHRWGPDIIIIIIIIIPSTRSRWLAAIIGSWTSTNMACRFRHDAVFERRVKTIFDPVPNSRAQFYSPSLAEGYYWLYTSSANQEDTSIGTSGSELTEPKSPKARQREEPQEERRVTILRQPLRSQRCRKFETLRISSTFFFLPEIVFLILFQFLC